MDEIFRGKEIGGRPEFFYSEEKEKKESEGTLFASRSILSKLAPSQQKKDVIFRIRSIFYLIAQLFRVKTAKSTLQWKESLSLLEGKTPPSSTFFGKSSLHALIEDYVKKPEKYEKKKGGISPALRNVLTEYKKLSKNLSAKRQDKAMRYLFQHKKQVKEGVPKLFPLEGGGYCLVDRKRGEGWNFRFFGSGSFMKQLAPEELLIGGKEKIAKSYTLANVNNEAGESFYSFIVQKAFPDIFGHQQSIIEKIKNEEELLKKEVKTSLISERTTKSQRVDKIFFTFLEQLQKGGHVQQEWNRTEKARLRLQAGLLDLFVCYDEWRLGLLPKSELTNELRQLHRQVAETLLRAKDKGYIEEQELARATEELEVIDRAVQKRTQKKGREGSLKRLPKESLFVPFVQKKDLDVHPLDLSKSLPFTQEGKETKRGNLQILPPKISHQEVKVGFAEKTMQKEVFFAEQKKIYQEFTKAKQEDNEEKILQTGRVFLHLLYEMNLDPKECEKQNKTFFLQSLSPEEKEPFQTNVQEIVSTLAKMSSFCSSLGQMEYEGLLKWLALERLFASQIRSDGGSEGENPLFFPDYFHNQRRTYRPVLAYSFESKGLSVRMVGTRLNEDVVAKSLERDLVRSKGEAKWKIGGQDPGYIPGFFRQTEKKSLYNASQVRAIFTKNVSHDDIFLRAIDLVQKIEREATYENLLGKKKKNSLKARWESKKIHRVDLAQKIKQHHPEKWAENWIRPIRDPFLLDVYLRAVSGKVEKHTVTTERGGMMTPEAFQSDPDRVLHYFYEEIHKKEKKEAFPKAGITDRLSVEIKQRLLQVLQAEYPQVELIALLFEMPSLLIDTDLQNFFDVILFDRSLANLLQSPLREALGGWSQIVASAKQEMNDLFVLSEAGEKVDEKLLEKRVQVFLYLEESLWKLRDVAEAVGAPVDLFFDPKEEITQLYTVISQDERLVHLRPFASSVYLRSLTASQTIPSDQLGNFLAAYAQITLKGDSDHIDPLLAKKLDTFWWQICHNPDMPPPPVSTLQPLLDQLVQGLPMEEGLAWREISPWIYQKGECIADLQMMSIHKASAKEKRDWFSSQKFY